MFLLFCLEKTAEILKNIQAGIFRWLTYETGKAANPHILETGTKEYSAFLPELWNIY